MKTTVTINCGVSDEDSNAKKAVEEMNRILNQNFFKYTSDVEITITSCANTLYHNKLIGLIALWCATKSNTGNTFISFSGENKIRSSMDKFSQLLKFLKTLPLITEVEVNIG